MAVIARVTCNAVEHYLGSTAAKFSPVVTAQDPHDEEIKAFHAATPSGKVVLSVPGEDAPLGAKPGQQFYVLQEPAGDATEVDESQWLVKVTSVSLGWSTQVKLAAATPSSSPWQNPCELEFSIRNELAAEQFQVGREFVVTLEPIPDV